MTSLRSMLLDDPPATNRSGDHVCDERSVDYSAVEEGRLSCRVCPRRWVLTPPAKGSWGFFGGGWSMYPEGPKPDRHERDYWFARTTPQPKLTEAEIIAKRERRLEMLARKERERAERFDENDQAWQRLQAKTGYQRFDLQQALKKQAEKKPQILEIPFTHTTVFGRVSS